MLSNPVTRAKTVIASLVVAVLYAIITNIRTVTASGWTPSSFRGLGRGDQLSYFAIVSNVAAGRSGDTEPFTETGVSYYPRGYYVLMGHIARLTGMAPELVWWLLGIFLQMALVFVVAFVIIKFTRRLWVAFLAPIPFVAGTFATFFAHDWRWPLDSHAVIWGTFAPLYTLNGEAAGIVIASSFFLFAIAVALLGKSRGFLGAVFVLSGLAIGSLANVQTYTFFTSVFLVAYTVAAFAMISNHSKKMGVLSVVLIPVVYVAGPIVSTEFGPLVALASGLLPAAPGVILSLVKWTKAALPPLLAIAITASPSIVSTAMGLRDGDLFLTYRTASSKDLGVELIPALVGGITVIAIVVVILAYGILRRNHLLTSLAVGPFVVWALLSTNDIWGANQEPYRFWIDCFAILSIVLFPVAAYVLSEWASEARATGSSPRTPIRVKGIVVVLIVVYVLSLADFAVFSRYVAKSIPFGSPAYAALSEVALAAKGEVVVLDKCIDGKIYKAVSGSPVAIFNYGMAWPEKPELFAPLQRSMRRGPLDTDIMKELGFSLILAQDNCKNTWKDGLASSLTLIDHVKFDGGGYTLYRLTR